VVALTKSDLVDSDTLGLVRLEVEEYLRGSFLESAPIVAVSAKTREQLTEFKQELHRAANEIPGKDATRHFRLPIDRAFAIKGFGAVVTGTLISGSVGAGNEVELFPAGEVLRVRGVQSGGKPVEHATAGQRTAVNLAGIEHTALERGMVLAVPGKFRLTRRIDARLELLSSAPKLKQRSRVHFHTGASETVAEVFLFGWNALPPGESALVQLRLQDEVLVLPGDRFIVRQFSPVTTIGGGAVLDALARRPTLRDTGRAEFLETLERGNRAEILGAMIERSLAGLSAAEIVARTGWMDEEVRQVSQELALSGQAKNVSAEALLLIPARLFAETRQKIAEHVDKFQKENPLVQGISRDELRRNLGRRVRSETFRAALEELAAEKKVEVQGDLVRPAGSAVSLDPEEARAKQQIEMAFSGAGLAVPATKEVLGALLVEAKRAERILQILLREKVLVRVTSELIFHRDALAQMCDRLASYKKTKGERITVPAFKEITGISRKYAIPLLEYLDRQRVTRRAGDERVIL
jgi:selenocysteine-specific elongation factor